MSSVGAKWFNPDGHVGITWKTSTLALLILSLLELALWHPWTLHGRTITVQGQATLQQQPDLFTFTPVYTGSTPAEATSQAKAAVVALEKLGVRATDIQSTVGASDSMVVLARSQSVSTAVSSFLVTSGAGGTLNPATSISQAMRSRMDATARKLASRDARNKADMVARGLRGKVGTVDQVTEAGTVIGTSSSNASGPVTYRLNVVFSLH
jgi:uncharacterized protein YggE